MAKNVVNKNKFTAAVSKCSGNPMYYIPLANGGGVATSIVVANSGEEISTFLSFNHFRFTLI
jgi:hypothetical protein